VNGVPELIPDPSPEDETYEVSGTAIEETPRKARSISAVLGPAYQPKKPLQKAVGPGASTGKRGTRNLLSLMGMPSHKDGKGSAGETEQSTQDSPENNEDLDPDDTAKEQCLMFWPYPIKNTSGPSSSDELSQTTKEDAVALHLQEEDKEAGLEQALKPERRRKIVLDKSDEPDALEDTARSKGDPDIDEDTPLDYDSNGEPVSHHWRSVDPVCIVSKNPKDDQIVATFCTSRLQSLVAQERRLNLPQVPQGGHGGPLQG
jgi:hypothetical protein